MAKKITRAVRNRADALARAGRSLRVASKDMELPIAMSDKERKRPDNYPSVAAYLEANGRLNHLTYAQQMKARHLFIQGVPVKQIAKETRLAISVIERLAFVNEWEEERDKRLVAQFRRVNKLFSRMPKAIDERHDRIVGTIETVAERLLQAHQDERAILGPKELLQLTSIIKATREVRLSCRGRNIPKRAEVTVTHEMPQEIEKLATALTDAVNERPRIAAPRPTRQVLEVSVGEAIGTDEEFEK